jgi:hypothetical protein
MTFQEIEELVRKYLSTGIAVVVILVAPGTDATTGDALPSKPSIKVIEPGVSGSPAAAAGGGKPADTAPDAADERTGAAGRDPERSSDTEPGDTGSSGSASGSGSQDSDDDPSGDATDNAPRSTDGSGGHSAAAGENDADPPDDGNDTGDNDTTSNTGTGNDSNESDSSESKSNSDENDMSSGSASGDERGDSASDSDSSDSRYSGSASDSGSSDRADGSRDSAGARSATGSGASAGITAAEQHGWGTPTREDDFSSGTDQWDIYDGPGHGGEGTRSPSAVSVEDGLLTITGDSSGTTAGMAWNPGQKYGRWEGRVRAPVSDPSYNALLLLWPDAEDFPVGGEIDFMEMMDHTRQKTDIFIHYGKDNSQVNGSVEVDGTEWHNWALEWTPEAITAYVDGEEWYRTTDTSIFPPGPMHLCIQLDWFPEGDEPKQSIMEVDWVRQYSLDGSTGDDATTSRRSSADEDDDEPASAEDSSRESDEGDEDESPVRELLRRLFSWR